MDSYGYVDTKELLFEVTAHFTGSIEFGANLQAITSGKSAPPPEGARFDTPVEGAVEGPKLKGKAHSMDRGVNLGTYDRAVVDRTSEVDSETTQLPHGREARMESLLLISRSANNVHPI